MANRVPGATTFDIVNVNGAGAHELFEYLRRETMKGRAISWNYNKWLIDGSTGKVLQHRDSR